MVPTTNHLISISRKPQRATSSTLFWPFDCFQWAHISIELDFISIWSFYLLTLMHPLMITIKNKCSKWHLEDEKESISSAQRFKTHRLSGPAAALFLSSLFAGLSNRVPILCVWFGFYKIFFDWEFVRKYSFNPAATYGEIT